MMHANTSDPGIYWMTQLNQWFYLKLCQNEHETLMRVRCNAELELAIQINFRILNIHASCKKTACWSFDQQRTQKMIYNYTKI